MCEATVTLALGVLDIIVNLFTSAETKTVCIFRSTFHLLNSDFSIQNEGAFNEAIIKANMSQ